MFIEATKVIGGARRGTTTECAGAWCHQANLSRYLVFDP